MKDVHIAGVRIHLPALLFAIGGMAVGAVVAPEVFIGMPSPGVHDPMTWETAFQKMKWIPLLLVPLCIWLHILGGMTNNES